MTMPRGAASATAFAAAGRLDRALSAVFCRRRLRDERHVARDAKRRNGDRAVAGRYAHRGRGVRAAVFFRPSLQNAENGQRHGTSRAGHGRLYPCGEKLVLTSLTVCLAYHARARVLFQPSCGRSPALRARADHQQVGWRRGTGDDAADAMCTARAVMRRVRASVQNG